MTIVCAKELGKLVLCESRHVVYSNGHDYHHHMHIHDSGIAFVVMPFFLATLKLLSLLPYQRVELMK